MTSSLSGKGIVVTGAFGALGASTARTLADAGGRVALIDRASHAPPGLISACGTDAAEYGGIDLTQPVHAANTINDIYRRFGRLDALVNVAGAFRWQTLAELDPDTWDLLHAINVKTVLNTSKAALPHLTKNGGRIINIGAAAAIKAGAGMGPYAAFKAGVHRLTESLAEELKETGITVNAVLPSIIFFRGLSTGNSNRKPLSTLPRENPLKFEPRKMIHPNGSVVIALQFPKQCFASSRGQRSIYVGQEPDVRLSQLKRALNRVAQ
jgi:NAD(P)-dependent dehydrogenase (short-subunit alcohol dehydrogenase family)